MNSSPQLFKFECPSCGQRISAEPSVAGTTQNCPTCSQSFQVPWHEGKDGEPEDYSSFAWAERILMKMILGVPRFMFWVIPREIIMFFERSLPCIVRLARVCTLLVIWMAMVLWPFALKNRYPRFFFEMIDYRDPLIIEFNSGWLEWFCWIWLGLAIAGSFWGIAYIAINKRRHRKKQQEEQFAAAQVSSASRDQ